MFPGFVPRSVASAAVVRPNPKTEESAFPIDAQSARRDADEGTCASASWSSGPPRLALLKLGTARARLRHPAKVAFLQRLHASPWPNSDRAIPEGVTGEPHDTRPTPGLSAHDSSPRRFEVVCAGERGSHPTRPALASRFRLFPVRGRGVLVRLSPRANALDAVAVLVAGLRVLGEGVARLALVGPLRRTVVTLDDREGARRAVARPAGTAAVEAR